MLWPGSRDEFTAGIASLAADVKNVISEQDLDELLAPHITDDFVQAFFPGFTAYRQPDVSVRLFNRFRCLPAPLRSAWHSRLRINTLGAIAHYDNDLRDVVKDEGPASGSDRAAKIIGLAISKNWGFALWSWGQAAAAPDKTFFCFDLLALNCCFVIETVESRVNEKPGGWRLVEEVLHVLDCHGTEQGIPWIHTTATNPEAAKLFRRYGFVDDPFDLGFHSDRATRLRQAVRTPIRPLDVAPPDLKNFSSRGTSQP